MFLLHLFDAAFSTTDNYLSHESAELITDWLLFSSHGLTISLIQAERKTEKVMEVWLKN